MKNKILFFFLSLLVCGFSLSAKKTEGYIVRFDLTAIKKDKLHISVVTPKTTHETVEYVIPSVIPGSYAQKDFGRFVENFKAINHQGKCLRFTKIDDNVFKIFDAQKLARVEYDVNDTWDSKLSNYVFQPGGSNIDQNNVVVNHHAFYGYLEGYSKLPYQLEIIHPKTYYGATALKRVKESKSNKDIFVASSFVQLVDNPILYCEPDTISFYAGRTKVSIAVYSETGKVKAEAVQEIIKPLSVALTNFFEVMPVEEYHFLMYFPELRFGNHVLNQMTFGALEHSYCSFYFLPEYADLDQLKQLILSVAAHEFLHILTPLNIHSQEIENFDFRNPKMSRHLWLYEGVTEYFSYLIQLRSGLMDYSAMMAELREKIKLDLSYEPVSFTQMSQQIVEARYQKMYMNVYAKGALIAMLLDIRLNELSYGQMNLRKLMLKLSEKYGPEKPFNDASFIDEIEAMTYPEIGDFFRDYVIGRKRMPYEKYFAKIGWEYIPEMNQKVLDFGNLVVDFDTDNERYFVRRAGENVFGLRKGDIITQLADEKLTKQHKKEIISFFDDPQVEELIKMQIQRGEKKMKVTGRAEMRLEKRKHLLQESDNPGINELQLRSWLFGAYFVNEK